MSKRFYIRVVSKAIVFILRTVTRFILSNFEMLFPPPKILVIRDSCVTYDVRGVSIQILQRIKVSNIIDSLAWLVKNVMVGMTFILLNVV